MEYLKISSLFKTVKENTVLYLGICLLFIGLSVYIYFYMIKPQMKKKYIANKEFIYGDENEGATLYLFSVDWCPYCKKAKPIWEDLKNEVGDTYNGVKIYFVEVDCEREKDLASKYKISGYPTIKLIYNGEIIEYDAKPDVDTLKEFLNSSI